MLFTSVTCYIVIVLIAAARGKMDVTSSHGVPIYQECGTGSNGGDHSFAVRQELEEQRKKQLQKDWNKKKKERRKKGKKRKTTISTSMKKGRAKMTDIEKERAKETRRKGNMIDSDWDKKPATDRQDQRVHRAKSKVDASPHSDSKYPRCEPPRLKQCR